MDGNVTSCTMQVSLQPKAYFSDIRLAGFRSWNETNNTQKRREAKQLKETIGSSADQRALIDELRMQPKK